ncbi:hypothetical protein PV08_05166 [Exophiala spinifera]|uniref:Uncharacterized protein n=1 Tax=Exophiala spinifera TaxID=91928 RepID=A0A0D1YRW6_9EURO|nr:uncharacterized protein PV08_05166 [Exophiala spinifera]KIW17971.1 hypothetical protein PV08_05166 [Exophiala spinifera]
MSYTCLKGKTYIVTGAASGIGREISIRLAKQGANIGLVDLQMPDQVLAEVVRAGAKGFAVAANVCHSDEIETAFGQIAHHFGGLDGGVNFAGIIGKNYKLGQKETSLQNLQDDDWSSVINVNLGGVMNSIRAELKLMKGPGAIVNAASLAAQIPTPYNSPYGASKQGVISLTRAAAQEVGARRIRVNAVAPGFVKTPMLEQFSNDNDVIQKRVIEPRVALGRMADPEDVARAVLFLLSEEAAYITGHVSFYLPTPLA